MTIDEYFGDWTKVIDIKEAERIANELKGRKICPDLKDIFKAFHLCPLKDLRMVIIGQDPYYTLKNGRPVATGIAFANSPDTPQESYSSSLDILRESVIDFTIPHRRINFDPSLERWEAQGVLLLNAALSCEIGKPGSHMLKWKPFMAKFLENLSDYTIGIVYILMGNSAQSLRGYIDGNSNIIINVPHPSWYARQRKRMPSDIWKQADTLLTRLNGSSIEWYQEY